MSAGKGDKPRPVNKRKFDDNYDQIFRKKKKKDHKISQLKARFAKLKFKTSVEGMRILDQLEELE